MDEHELIPAKARTSKDMDGSLNITRHAPKLQTPDNWKMKILGDMRGLES